MLDTGDGAQAPGDIDMGKMREALMADPEWVRRDGELMACLAGDAGGGAVIDFGAAARARLLDENRRLKAARAELAQNARANLAILSQTHVATLSLMECTSLDNLDSRLDGDLASVLAVDAIRIFVEGVAPSRSARTIRPAAPGLADQLLAAENDFTGAVSPATAQALYGADMRSHALVRMDLPGGFGVLALASRDSNAFTEGQGTEFLNFLARAVERRISPWLETP